MSTLGTRIKELRREKWLLQDELAQEIGVSKGTISVWERDVRKPEHRHLLLLCDYFQVNLAYLLGEDVDRSPVYSNEELVAFGESIDRHQVYVSFFRRFIRLSPEMQDVVKQTLQSVYKFDKKRGALEAIDEKEIAEVAKKIIEGRFWRDPIDE